MKKNHEKSLELIGDIFSNIDDATFLKEYQSMEKNIGPTIEMFTTINLYSKFIVELEYAKYEELLGHEYYKNKELSNQGINDVYASNDEQLLLAA
ncbi:MAG: hypothetical protein GQ582_10590 [Methyloprofundus sp.]|nr:hypothetical protein [Methyloprofundus sp.]